jgi:hypothetical protein
MSAINEVCYSAASKMWLGVSSSKEVVPSPQVPTESSGGGAMVVLKKSWGF